MPDYPVTMWLARVALLLLGAYFYGSFVVLTKLNRDADPFVWTMESVFCMYAAGMVVATVYYDRFFVRKDRAVMQFPLLVGFLTGMCLLLGTAGLVLLHANAELWSTAFFLTTAVMLYVGAVYLARKTEPAAT